MVKDPAKKSDQRSQVQRVPLPQAVAVNEKAVAETVVARLSAVANNVVEVTSDNC